MQTTPSPLTSQPTGPVPVPPENELALVRRLRAGDPAAFELLVRDNAGRMLAVARRLLPVEDDAQDAVQDAFLNAFKAIADFEGSSLLSTWLHRITVNSALQRLRKQNRKHEVAIEDLLPRFLEDGHQADPAVEWRSPASVQLEAEETRRIVREAIDRLPEMYRTVLLLRDIEGLDTEETARILDLNLNTVKIRLHRARQAIRGLLAPSLQGATD